MTPFERELDAAKRSTTLHLLFKASRLLNARAIASLPSELAVEQQPRAAHLALLPYIELDGGTRTTLIAEKAGITKQAVGQLVDELEAIGFCARVADPDDRRAKRVVFTDQGRTAILAGLEHLRRVEAELALAVGGDVIAQLRDALLILDDYLDADEG